MKTSILCVKQGFPLVFEPENQLEASSLIPWIKEHPEYLSGLLAQYGAVLFRGFGVDDPSKLRLAAETFGGNLGRYRDGNSPRTSLPEGVYTSTEYPPGLFISLHNELSYAPRWPAHLFFCCATTPAGGGETPLANSRVILQNLERSLVDEFQSKKLKYIRNLHGGNGYGKSWQQTFETLDRKEVSRYVEAPGSHIVWTNEEGMRIINIRPATAVHPITGDEVWFNQADQFHPSTHPPAVYESLQLLYEGREDEMPQYVRFGDDSEIDVSALNHIREVIRERMVPVSWIQGDFLILDNMLVCHGRMPFTPPRRVLVAMAGELQD
ncbi:MAG TPA: TauD/TfdA family dioxygenase [Blastocatellia bacterium]|nr:TauD/TfdA family dioxygenase [Blastocatellia bacterium]